MFLWQFAQKVAQNFVNFGQNTLFLKFVESLDIGPIGGIFFPKQGTIVPPCPPGAAQNGIGHWTPRQCSFKPKPMPSAQ